MAVLLDHLLDLPVLKPARVRTALGACRRPVSWASVIEMPVEDFVRPNELVLTTGMGCGSKAAGFIDFVGQVIDSDAAAIAVSTGRYIQELPPALELAEASSFPIIELPWEVRFADITRAVSEALLAEEHNALLRSQSLQATVLERVVAGASAADVAEVLAEELGEAICLADASGRILASGHGGVRKGAAVRRVPIHSSSQTEGFILLSGASEVTTQALEHVSAACSFWFLHHRALQEAEARRQDDFVWSLAKGQLDVEEATGQGSVLGHRLDRPRVCVLGRPSPPAAPDESEADHRRLAKLIDQAARAGGYPYLATFQSGLFVLYLESPDEKLAVVHRFLDDVDRVLAERGRAGRVSWGLAPAGRDVEGFARGYAAAKQALDAGCRQWGPGHRASSEDLRLYQVLAAMAADPATGDLVAETLGPLIDYDERKQGQLVDTLGEFIRSRGQASKTAQNLVLHRQSLLYRLSKIESLTGRSLSDPDDWFQLSLAHRLLLLDRSGPDAVTENDDNR